VADVLSSGPEPDAAAAAPRRRWTTAFAGMLVAATTAVLAVNAGGSPDRGGAAPVERGSLSVVVRPAPTPARTGPPAASAVFRLDGVPGRGPAGLRVLVGGRHPGVLDLATGRLSPLARVLTHPDDVVAFDHLRGLTTAVLHNPGRLRYRGAVLTGGGRVTDLGPLLGLLPMRDGTVLTQDCAGGGGTGPCVLTSRAATGAVRWKRTIQRQLELVRDTPSGLLVRAYQGDLGGVARLEDARSGQVLRELGRTYHVLGADDGHVVFQPAGCAANCGLVLVELASGDARWLPETPGRPSVATLSPDGRQLAIGYAGLFPDDHSPTRQRDGYAVVMDLVGANQWQPVPGLSTAADSTPLPVWAPDGRVVIAVSDGGVGRFAVWRPGEGRFTVLPIRLTGFYGLPGMAVRL